MAFIEATVTGDDRLAVRLAAQGGILRAALVDSLKRQWYALQAKVVTGKLSGDPLHRRTGVLASSINVGGPQTASAFIESELEVIGRVGTNVWYGAVHENGGAYTIPAHTRHITSAFGREIAGRDVSVSSYVAHFPQRSFLRSTLAEERPGILAAIQADIARATATAGA